MNPHCPNLKTDYHDLFILKEQFQVALKEAAKSGNFHTLVTLKQEIENKKASLEEKLIPFETKLHIKEQYETQKKAFEKIGLLETREGILGIEAIDGTFHPFPTIQEVRKRLRGKKELLTHKIEQGFGRLLIVPFGMKLETFTETMKKTILAHYVGMPDPRDPKKGIPDPTLTKLWSTNRDGTKTALKLDTTMRLDQWDEYLDADTTDSLVYFPQAFDPDPRKHQGKTKKALLKEDAFHIMMLETNLNIPRATTGKTIEGRKQLEANMTPKQCLELLQKNPQYQHEQGLTPEAWMTLFLLELEKTDTVIDDLSGNGSANYNLGGYFPVSGQVSGGAWYRLGAYASLDRCGVTDQHSAYGSRFAVPV